MKIIIDGRYYDIKEYEERKNNNNIVLDIKFDIERDGEDHYIIIDRIESEKALYLTDEKPTVFSIKIENNCYYGILSDYGFEVNAGIELSFQITQKNNLIYIGGES